MTHVAPSIPQIDLSLVPESMRAQVQALLELVKFLIGENQVLRARMDAFVRRYFGNNKNESLTAEQLELALKDFTQQVIIAAKPEASVEVPKQEKNEAKGVARRRVPDNLPIRNQQTLIPEEVQENPEAWRKIDESVTDILDYEPGRLVRDQIIRPRFVLKQACDETSVVAAPLPNRLIEKGLPGVGLLVFVLIERFQNHLPYYRLQQMFAQRHQFSLSRQTMTDWTASIAQWLVPLLAVMRENLIRGDYLQVDETPIRYLDRDEPGKSHTGFLWAYSHPKGDVVFDWKTSRGRDGPKEFLNGFRGVLQTDGYAAYISLAKENPDLILSHCVTHWRRTFIQAKDEDRRSLWFLGQFRLLYAVEAKCRRLNAGPKLREAYRASESKVIWNRLDKAIHRLETKVLPQSLLGKALAYGRNQWEGLKRFLDDGGLEIDTNLVENAIRPTAIGKKNFLFIGHPDAGWKSAVFYSIIESCRRRGINAQTYLQDVLTLLPDMKQSELKNFVPQEWIKHHPEARLVPVK